MVSTQILQPKKPAPAFRPVLQLVQQIRERNIPAMEFLYDEYSALIFGHIMRKVNSQAAAEDICEKVFLRVWREIDEYDEQKCRVYTWMVGISNEEAGQWGVGSGQWAVASGQ